MIPNHSPPVKHPAADHLQDIFVHSDSSTMLRHVRHSARYFRYYPTESVTHFFSSFLRSLQNIEE